jgi:hypothetical protein
MPITPGKSHGEVAYMVDLSDPTHAQVVVEITLEELGLKERADLQEWVKAHPEFIERDLLLITTEFDRWGFKDQKVVDRLDVLFLHADGSPVVAELKRGFAPDTVDSQALKYAAYCNQLTLDQVVDDFAAHQKVSLDEARAALLDHAPSLAEGELGPVRIRLVAAGFSPAVTSVVLFLREHDLDIGCVQFVARRIPVPMADPAHKGFAVLSARPIIPLPQAEDYLVQRRRKEKAEDEKKERNRRTTLSVQLLADSGRVKPGDPIRLNLDRFTTKERPKIDALLAENPEAAEARWTGRGSREALQSKRNDEFYSCTSLIKALMDEAGLPLYAIPGPEYWLLENGNTVYAESKLIQDELAATGTGTVASVETADTSAL